MKGGWETAKWLTDELPFLGRSSLKPHCAIPTSVRASLYDLWSLGPPLPIPLRVQFSDKQKHIQALASHFTLCALAGGNAFLEPLAYSPKNGSSWLSFKKKKKRVGLVGRHHMWRIRPHLSSSTLSAQPLLPEPPLLPVSWWTSPPGGHTHACWSYLPTRNMISPVCLSTTSVPPPPNTNTHSSPSFRVPSLSSRS